MNGAELIFLSVGLAMDAFAVSVCKGLSVQNLKARHILLCGFYFGLFQAIMPVIGFFAGNGFAGFISSFDHWIVFAILVFLGINMIRSSFDKDDNQTNDFSAKTMLALAVATSIDALAIGVSFSLLHANIVYSAICIGSITFVIAAIGVVIGNRFGTKFKNKAEIAGGIILIIIGVRILVEHLITGA